jgi:hypothetical protein
MIPRTRLLVGMDSGARAYDGHGLGSETNGVPQMNRLYIHVAMESKPSVCLCIYDIYVFRAK